MAKSPRLPEPQSISPREIETMACVLEGRHGIHAADVALFLVSIHEESNDTARAEAWMAVASIIRAREQFRMPRQRAVDAPRTFPI